MMTLCIWRLRSGTGSHNHVDAFPGVRDIIPTSQVIDAAGGASVTGRRLRSVTCS